MPKDNRTSNLKVNINEKYEKDQIIKIMTGQSIIKPQPSYSSRYYSFAQKSLALKSLSCRNQLIDFHYKTIEGLLQDTHF